MRAADERRLGEHGSAQRNQQSIWLQAEERMEGTPEREQRKRKKKLSFKLAKGKSGEREKKGAL